MPRAKPTRVIPAAPEARFAEHRQLAAVAARRYRRTPHAVDIRQVADIALWAASTRYDPARGPFERYASATIAGEIKKYLRSSSWPARVPRRAQEDALTLRRTVDELTATLGRTPSVPDIIRATEWTAERLAGAQRADDGRFASSDPGVSERVPSSENAGDIDVIGAVDGLPEPMRTIVRLTYDHELTQREIGHYLQISQTRVHRLLARAHAALADALGPTTELAAAHSP